MEELKLKNIDKFIEDCINESHIDIDSEFCNEINFKFENDDVNLLTTDINKRAFQFVFPKANVDID